MTVRELDDLAERFWTWRAQSRPQTRDDIPRLTRPVGWLPDIGLDALDRREAERAAFAAELARIEPVVIADRVDHRLLRSALARVQWENDVVRGWTQPRFYLDQALGPVYEALLRPGVDAARVAEVVRLLGNVPAVVEVAIDVLPGRAVAEMAGLAIDELTGIEGRLGEFSAALGPVDPSSAEALHEAAAAAGAALAGYRRWLLGIQPELPPAQPIGREAFAWFLREVACIPLAVEDLRIIGRIEADRAAVRERLERNSCRGVPEPALPSGQAEQIAREAADELAVRDFYLAEGLLDQPESLRHYLNAPMPAYLWPLHFLGVSDDLTGPDRLGDNGISYVPPPAADLPYFYAANARDPRAGIVHEGAHFQQLALSWANPRPVRRHYYDSAANEGIAFYNEEMLLAAGLFQNAPHTRVTMWNFMRLRALRVELDVGLAVGDLSIAEAADRLVTGVPMDAETAAQEAAFFAETPGQALTYQIGKTQLQALLADAMALQGSAFDLRTVNSAVWRNGNVPIALLRYELLGLTDELEVILADPVPPPVPAGHAHRNGVR